MNLIPCLPELGQLIKREIHQFFVDSPMRVLFLFGAAIAYLILFGILYTPNIVKNIPLIIYDQDQTSFSRSLVRAYDSSDAFTIVGNVNSEEEMDVALQNKTAYAAVYIPADFSKKVKTGDTSTPLFVVNGSNIILTNITSSAAQNITADFSNKIAAQQGALRLGMDESRLAKRINPVTYETRVLNNPTQGYMLFFLIGLAMAAFQQGIFFTLGSSVHYELREWEERVASSEGDVALTDRRRGHLLFAAKLITYWVMALLAFSVILLAAHFGWQLPLKAPLYQVYGLAGAFAFAFIGFSLLISLLCQNELQFIRLAVLYPVPAFIMSGYTWPQESMGQVLQTASYFFPIAWLSNAMRQLFTAGYAAHLPLNILVLVAIGLGCCLLAGWRLHGVMKKI